VDLVGHDVGKSEHNGPKNGGGYWGPRAVAKAGGRKARRADDADSADEEFADWRILPDTDLHQEIVFGKNGALSAGAVAARMADRTLERHRAD
jgi:hypothetical protein